MLNYKNIVIALLAVFVGCLLFFKSNNQEKLEVENQTLRDSSLVYKAKAKMYIDMYENLKREDSLLVLKKDSLLVEKQKTQIKYVEKIKLVSKYSVSDMQCYFNERTGKSCGTGQRSVGEDNQSVN